MAKYFTAKIYQEYSNSIINSALSLNIPPERIVFKTQDCSLGSIGVYIKFDDEEVFDKFLELVQEIPCIQEMW